MCFILGKSVFKEKNKLL